MRVLPSKKRWAAAIVGVAAIATFATVALASHAPNLFGIAGSEILVTGNLQETVRFNSDRVKFQTKGPTDVRVQKIVVGAGGSSGWHHHPGIVIVAVASGTLTVTHSDCTSTTYGPDLQSGSVFVEGGDEPGFVSSTTGATLYATYVAPDANPSVFRIDDHDAPSCP